MLSVIIVSYNTREITKKCLTQLYAGKPDIPMEVVVVDNGSQDHSLRMLKAYFPAVKVIANQKNMGFAAACNQGLRKSRGSFVLFLNPDCFVKRDAISKVMAFMKDYDHVGVCGGLLVNQQGVQQPSARDFPNLRTKMMTLAGLGRFFPKSQLINGHHYLSADSSAFYETDWVPGAFAMCRRTALDQVGGFDERYFLYYEETDMCRAIKEKGWQIFVVPSAVITHIGGASSKKTDEAFDKDASQITRYRMISEWLYFRKNHGLVAVVLQAGFEMAWYGLRWLKQGLGSSRRTYHKLMLRSHLNLIKQTLESTRFGSVSPALPW